MNIPAELLQAQQAIASLYFRLLSSSVEALGGLWDSLGLPHLDLGVLSVAEFAGVGIEFRRGANGQLFDDLALVVYTKSDVGWPRDIHTFFPPPASNVAVSWRRTGAFQPLATARPVLKRPATPGVSIGSDFEPASKGTLGAVVQNGAGEVFILSCNHVLVPHNRSVPEPGLKILQPSLIDDPTGGARNAVATMTTLDPFCQLQELPTVSNGDFAIARTASAMVVQASTPPDMPGLKPAPPLSPDDFLNNHSDKRLLKFGGTTQRRTGKLATPVADFTMNYGFIAGFQQKYFVVSDDPQKHFAEPGDSGSLVVTEDGFAVGLAFAIDQDVDGGPDRVVCPLDQLFSHLGLSFVIPN